MYQFQCCTNSCVPVRLLSPGCTLAGNVRRDAGSQQSFLAFLQFKLSQTVEIQQTILARFSA
jgi:hypothetical protein